MSNSELKSSKVSIDMIPLLRERKRLLKFLEELFQYCDQGDMLIEKCCKDCAS